MPESRTRSRERRRRKPGHSKRLTRRLLISAAVLGVLAILIFVAPTYAARWYLAERLDGMGMVAEGVDSLQVSLIGGEARIGPLEVWSGDAEHALLLTGGVELDYGALFAGNLLLEDIIVSGLALTIAWDENGKLSINGIDLDQLTQRQGSDATRQDAQDAAPWGLGVGNLLLQEAAITLAPPTGEPVTLDVDRVRLEDLKSWQPDGGGDLSLAVAMEGLEIDASGKVHLLPGVIAAHLEQTVASDRLARYVSLIPTPNATLDGGAAWLDLTHDVALAMSGPMRVATSGTVVLSDVEASRADGATVSVRGATLQIANLSLASRGGGMTAEGDLTAEVGAVRVEPSGGGRYRIGAGTAALPDLRLSMPADGSLRLSGQPDLEVSDLEAIGVLDASAETAAVDLSELVVARDGDGTLTNALARGTVRLDQARTNAGGLNARVGSAELNLGGLTIAPAAEGSGMIIAGRPELTLQSPALTGATEARAERFALDLAELEVATAGPATSVLAEGSARLEGAQLPAGGGRLTVGSTVVDLRGMDVGLQPGGALKVAAQPRISVQNAELSGDASGSVSDLTLTFSSLQADTGGRRTTVVAAGDGRLQSGDFTLPRAGDEPPLSGAVDAVDTSFRNLEAQLGGGAPQWQGDLDVQISGLSGRVAGGDVARAQVGDVDIEDVQAESASDSGLEVAAKDVEVADVNMVVTRKLIGAFGSGSEQQQGDGADVRVGRFRTVGDAEVQFRDRMIDPTFQSTLNVDELRVRDLNTGEPQQAAQIRLLAVLNEFTNLRVTGTASPLADQPEFDLEAKVKGLDLPEASPYAREYAGVQVESGQLSADAEAAAKNGSLDASVDLTLSRVALEEAAADGALSGIPVQMGLALLEGPDGKVSLTLPVSGSLSNPDFDISQIISQAIGGALRTAIGSAFKILFPPAGIAALLSEESSASVQDVPFEAGSTELTQQAQTVVEGYGELLSRRPKLSLEVCGRSTGADLDATSGGGTAGGNAQSAAEENTTPALRELALERTRSVRRYLTEQAGVSADRIITCRPQWNAQSRDQPSVEVSL